MPNNNQKELSPKLTELAKGARAPVVTVTPNVPRREGARAPIVATPTNVPRTSGPVSVTKPKVPVNHPAHYTSHPSGIECIQVTEHMGFNLGNAVKYVWRADLKNGVEDLKKARWYIDREITRREGKP